MKIGGKELAGRCIETLVLPREDEDIVIKAQALEDFEKFDKLCPEPSPPMRLTKRGNEPNFDDVNYTDMMHTYEIKRVGFMVVHSLEINDIEWDTVDIDNPKTWTNYSEDFKNAGFSVIETGRVVQTVLRANSLDEVKLEKARELFLRGQGEQAALSSGPSIVQNSLPSGPPVNDSESVPQE